MILLGAFIGYSTFIYIYWSDDRLKQVTELLNTDRPLHNCPSQKPDKSFGHS